MNRGVWILILAVLLIGSLIGAQIYVDNTIDTLSAKTKTLQAAISDGNKPKSITTAESIEKFWGKHQVYLTAILDHNEIEEIGKQINLVLSHLRADDLASALVECNALLYQAETSIAIFRFDFQNIL